MKSGRRAVLVVCGGRTEETYVRGVWRENGAHGHGLGITVKRKTAAPHQLVAFAAKVARDPAGEDFDEVWCVVDVDEFDIGAAERAARPAGVELVVSNPCFEVWLLLHHEDRTAAFGDAKEALTALRRHVPDFDKGRLRFDHFASGVRMACVRAKALDGNPSSGMWRIVEEMGAGT